ncbi:MAG: helix-turn-helix transcriptional regulator [Terracidiphilus sp.]|jgi:cytoskeletal protein RodZ
MWKSHQISIHYWSAMGNFGEDLRMERLSRGIALADITAVTKISCQYLEALEQERFRALPGGILSKGIVRGYASVVGLDQGTWTERYLKAYYASGLLQDDERDWMEFASNVGKARGPRGEGWGVRLLGLGKLLLVLTAAVGACLALRYLAVRLGWWHAGLPGR